MGEKDPRGDAGQSWGFGGFILQFQSGRRCWAGGECTRTAARAANCWVWEVKSSKEAEPDSLVGAPWWLELEPGLSPMAASQLLLDLHRQLCSQDEWQQLRNAADIPQLMFRAAAGGCISQKCGLGRRPVAQG